MNVILERRRQYQKDEAEFRKLEEEKNLGEEIMSCVHYLEDRGDAVVRSEHIGAISKALTEAYHGVRTRELRSRLKRFRKLIEEEVSGDNGM